MKIETATFTIATKGHNDILDITDEVRQILARTGIVHGQVTVFSPGSTGAVTSVEFEPGAVADLKRALERLAPEGDEYAHDRAWGDGNGYAHVRGALLKPELTVPVTEGTLALGTWQLVFIDFDNRPRRRTVIVQIIGESAATRDPAMDFG